MGSLVRAVIFDMDGLLVDSEPIHYETDDIQAKKYGRVWSLTLQQEFTGYRVIDTLAQLKKRWELTPTVDELLTERNGIFKRLIEAKVALRSGASDCVGWFDANRALLAIGTSAERWYADLILNKFRLGNIFRVVVTGEDVAHGKPDPEVYQMTAKRLGVAPAECLVLEDAKLGVLSAKAAGMMCFAVPGPYLAHEVFPEADKTFASLTQLLDYCKQQQASLFTLTGPKSQPLRHP